ncbi:hypothetical protein O6H91_11G057800 [Diphasiastrum complanatum]|uniref:Uncharacterized protein n=1 Tax=Diphasiastrum complanatum TaxID=34168 RepID=A0ACC2C9V1_DIPCM|nr:hypothetical protein O6H91_11G057800 [Diphasiastrum complanatum]
MVAESSVKGKLQPEQDRQKRAWLCMVLLTIQYGVQPLLSKRFSGKQVIMTSIVLSCEVLKVACALAVMAWEGSLESICKNWQFFDALTASALPAGVYALQNPLLQLSYRHLDSLTFSLLNQTKLLFTALFMFLILGHKQSKQQVGALLLLLVAALLISISQNASHVPSELDNGQTFLFGVVPVLVASVLSGLASTLCQWASQIKRRSSYLMTVEMSTIASMCLLVSMIKSPDGNAIKQQGFFSGWTIYTWGFVIVSALVVTAFLQYAVDDIPPSVYVLGALPLVILSNIIYQRYPYVVKEKAS